jgi:bacterioferritin
MKERSVELLNRVVAEELSAVHQYMYFHFHCDDQGFDLIAGLFKKTAIEEMIHVEHASERILFLGGEVEMAASEEVQKIHDVRQMLERSASMEEMSVKFYNEAAIECGANADSATKRIFEDLVMDEERHLDQYSTEMENMDKFGERYLVLQSMERSRSMSAGGGE